MIRSSSLAAAGGIIPRCFGFRLRPRPVAGIAIVAPPFPVRVRDQSTHQNEFLVFDASWYERVGGPRVDDSPSSRGHMLGPFQIDPNGEQAGWAWDVTWADEEGERVQPTLDGADAELGGALRVAKRATVIYDSGPVGAGAIVSPVFDLYAFEYLGLFCTNGDAAVRAVSWNDYADDLTQIGFRALGNAAAGGASIGHIGPGATALGGTILNNSAPLPPKGKLLVNAGTTAFRALLIAR
jgi:hypothetical protein